MMQWFPFELVINIFRYSNKFLKKNFLLLSSNIYQYLCMNSSSIIFSRDISYTHLTDINILLNIKEFDFTCCNYLKETLYLSKFNNLQKLNLSKCRELSNNSLSFISHL